HAKHGRRQNAVRREQPTRVQYVLHDNRDPEAFLDGFRYGQGYVQQPRVATKIAWNQPVTGLRIRIEHAEGGGDGADIAGLCERRAIREERIAVIVATRGDVERPSRSDRQRRINQNATGQLDAQSALELVTLIVGRSA